MIKRTHLTLFLLSLCITILSCSGARKTAEDLGLAELWEVDLIQNNGISTLKGQVVFKGNRYVYTWYQLMNNANDQSKVWRPVEMEQGNINLEKAGVMELLADSYGIPIDNDNDQNRDKVDYVLTPSKSNYLIHYEIQNNKLTWMEDSNFDGDFDDVNEKYIYSHVK